MAVGRSDWEFSKKKNLGGGAVFPALGGGGNKIFGPGGGSEGGIERKSFLPEFCLFVA